ncbi:OmpA family protein [Megalodesulfovibrio paquesii]
MIAIRRARLMAILWQLALLAMCLLGVGLRLGDAATLAGTAGAASVGAAVRFETIWDFANPKQAAAVAQTLRDVRTVLEKSPSSRLEIIGHTWDRGGEMLNRRISLRQAEDLKALLVKEYGLDAARIATRGMGAEEPLPGRKGRDAANRRLELVVQDRPSSPGAAGVSVPASARAAAPLYPMQAMPPPGNATARQTLYFANGRDAIHPDSLEALKQTAMLLLAWPQSRARLVGHADNRGDAARNLILSQARAETVRQALHAAFGIGLERMCVEGAGEADPIADNETADGRARNRRVEVLLEGVGASAGMTALHDPIGAATPAAATNQTAPTAPTGALVPPAPKLFVVDGEVMAAGPAAEKYVIEISLKQCALWLYERTPEGGRTLVREYKVATAKDGMDHPEGLGYVTKIDKNPWWYPTPDMKRRAAAKGQTLAPVAPGRKANPMGSVKIHLSHGPTYRIHGTNRPDQIGRRVSLGCIRMRNQDALELANLIDVGAVVNVAF